MDTRTLNGRYGGRVIDGLIGQGKKEEDVELVLTCEVKVGDQTARLAYRGYFTTEKAVETQFKALRAAGYTSTDMLPLYEEGAWAKAVPKPPEVEFVIEQEPDMEYAENGELVQKLDANQQPLMRARIKWINAGGAIGVRTPLSVDKAKLFAAKMKGQLAAFDAKNKTKSNGSHAQPPRGEEPPPPTDSDSPPF